MLCVNVMYKHKAGGKQICDAKLSFHNYNIDDVKIITVRKKHKLCLFNVFNLVFPRQQ